jgi:hypothetical protein
MEDHFGTAGAAETPPSGGGEAEAGAEPEPESEEDAMAKLIAAAASDPEARKKLVAEVVELSPRELRQRTVKILEKDGVDVQTHERRAFESLKRERELELEREREGGAGT